MVGYSKEVVDFIDKNRLKYTTDKMAKLLEEKFDKKITTKALRKYYYRHNLKFKRMYNRKDKYIFAKEIGFESPPDKNGLVRIKINDKQWKYKQRYIYEKYYGEIPEDYVVIFLDGDKNNYDIDNLYAVSKETAGTFYCISKKDKPTSKELTKLGLLIAEVKNKTNNIKENKYEK